MIYSRPQMPMRHIKKIRVTLHFGKQQSQEIHLGQLLGVQAAQVGTSNVQRWRIHTLVKHLIFTVAD
jgi:hypothetical protein